VTKTLKLTTLATIALLVAAATVGQAETKQAPSEGFAMVAGNTAHSKRNKRPEACSVAVLAIGAVSLLRRRG